MAFQIKDDLFDFLGSENETGKDSGGDVKEYDYSSFDFV